MQAVQEALKAFFEAPQDGDLQKLSKLVAEQPLALQGHLEDLRRCAQHESSNIRAWTCEAFALFLAASAVSDDSLVLEAWRMAEAILRLSGPPTSLLHLMNVGIRATFHNKNLKSPDTVAQAFTVLDQLMSVQRTASVTFQCSSARLFVEFLLILTGPSTKQLGQPIKEITAKVQGIVKILVGWLRFEKSQHQASCLTIAVVNTCGLLVTQRPGQAGRILPTLISLANTIAPAKDFSAASIQKAVKRSLLWIMQTDAVALHAWKSRIAAALKQLGHEEIPEQENKNTEELGRRSSRLKEKAQGQNSGNINKDSASQSNAVHASQDPRLQQNISQDPRLQAQRPINIPGSSHPAQAGRPDPSNSALPGPPPPPLRQDDLRRTVSLLAGHLSRNDLSACLAATDGLSPTLLADVVMAMMVNLPRREEIAGIDNQGPQKSGVALLTGLMQATAKSNTQPTVTKPEESKNKHDSEKQLHKSKPSETANSAKENTKESGTLAPKLPKPPKISPAPVQEIKLRAVQLDQQQREAAQVLALKRMHACKIGAMTDLRAKMIAHLLPQLQAGKQSKQWVEEMTKSWDEKAYDLTLGWLYSVYITTRKEEIPSQTGEAMESDDGTASIQPSQQYNECLVQLLAELRDTLPVKDRSPARLLLEVPALPKQILVDYLQSLLQNGGEYATLALITARDIVMNRPANRDEALQAVLGMSVSKDAELRAKSVRLIANKLFPETFLTEDIESFALSELWKLKALSPPGNKNNPSAEVKPEHQSSTVETVGEKRPRSEDTDSAKITQGSNTDDQSRAVKRSKVGSPITDGEKSEGVTKTDTAVNDHISEAETPETAARYCELYCALCTKRHALLRELFSTFGECRGLGRAAILRNAEGLARVLGPQAPSLLELVAQRPTGSSPLLLKMLNQLTETQTPPKVLVEACESNYAKDKEPGVIAAVIAVFPPPEILKFLPKLLAPIPLFNSALHRILYSPEGPKMSPAEILLALHSINHTRDGVTLRQIMAALDHCLTWRNMFDRTVLMAVLEQLCERASIPPLYMRFLMQAQAAVPSLKTCIVQLLSTLVNKHIWTNKSLFLGWNLAVRQNVPDSFPAFLQLPPRILSETLAASPEEFQIQLKEWAESSACPPNQKGPLSRIFDSIKVETKLESEETNGTTETTTETDQ